MGSADCPEGYSCMHEYRQQAQCRRVVLDEQQAEIQKLQPDAQKQSEAQEEQFDVQREAALAQKFGSALRGLQQGCDRCGLPALLSMRPRLSTDANLQKILLISF